MKRIARRTTVLVALVATVLLATAGIAGAADPLEGVWSFNGGQVAITGNADGTLTGTVVAPTTFSECTHPVGEQVWTDITPQPDGSYWGNHQWYYEGCAPNPTLGRTAFRVLSSTEGSRLEVCFSEPGSTSQPTIPADGIGTGATYGCSNSAFTSPLPTQAGLAAALQPPAPRGCLSTKSKLRLKLREPQSDPFSKLSVRLRSGTVVRRAGLAHRPGTVVAMLNLRGLTKPTFSVSVYAETVLGHHLKKKRRYLLCGATPLPRKHPRAAHS